MSRKSSAWRKKMFALLVERDGPTCVRCGASERRTCTDGGVFNSSDEFTERTRYTRVIWRSILEVEHTIPLHMGGTNEPDNLRLMCAPCHRAKTTAEQSARLKALDAGGNAPR